MSETDLGFTVGKLTNRANVRPTCSADPYLSVGSIYREKVSN